MKGLFKKMTGSNQAAPSHQPISMITNFNACPLGLALSAHLSKTQRVLVVSHDANDYL